MGATATEYDQITAIMDDQGVDYDTAKGIYQKSIGRDPLDIASGIADIGSQISDSFVNVLNAITGEPTPGGNRPGSGSGGGSGSDTSDTKKSGLNLPLAIAIGVPALMVGAAIFGRKR